MAFGFMTDIIVIFAIILITIFVNGTIIAITTIQSQ